MQDEAIAAHVEGLLDPTPTDVRRAKRAMLPVLEDGRAHRTPALLAAAAAELGAEPHIATLEIRFQADPHPDAISPDHPSLVYIRSRLAGMRGLAELAVTGVVLPAFDPRNDEPTHDPIATVDNVITIGIKTPSHGGGAQPSVDRPALAQAYMIAEPSEARWYMDPDLFAEGIEDLEITDRARRALRESLASFRRGLYLAAASLLGVVSEAAWYSAADKLGKPGKLEEAFRRTRTADLQSLVAGLFRERKIGRPTLADELLARASLLRELRNYGVHPAEERDDLERFFSEEECGLLILTTHRYLVDLAAATAEATGAETR